jgi:uncharacterized membrane protein YagU involved in acid resistance
MNPTRAAAAGLIGTGVMTALLLVEPSIGLPQIAIGQILSTSLGLVSARLPFGAGIGWLLHFLVGVALALGYAALLERRLPGSPLVRGAAFGMLVFLVAQVAFMPLVGSGMFSDGDPQLIAGSLIGHLVYGSLVGWIYGEPAGR